MRTFDVEAWALRAIERVEHHQPNEDARVELKAEWPKDPAKAARRIAGHANEMRGEPILWVIGVDEERGVLGASQNNLADWWPQVVAQFDGPVPRLRDVLVHWKGNTAVALCFESEQVPYVVKNPVRGQAGGGPVELEVPWREATRVRSATHSDLVLLLSPLRRPVLHIEVGKSRDCLYRRDIKLDKLFGANQPTTFSITYRVKVVNRGSRTAERCSGYLANVDFWQGRYFRETAYIDHLRLPWVGNGKDESGTLLPGVPRWLAVLWQREGNRHLNLAFEGGTGSYSEAFGDHGVYRLTIRVVAEDADTAEAFVFIKWDGGGGHLLDVFNEVEWEQRKDKET